MPDTRGTGPTDVDLAEAMIVALEEACFRHPHRGVLPYLGMARGELAQCRSAEAGRSFRLHEVSVTSVHEGLEELESLLTHILNSSTELRTTMRFMSARQLVREGLDSAF